MASGSNQAAHSTSAPLRKHDVFLSFYGEDTRKGFSDHLYTALKGKAIFVYRDEEELKRGENISELLKAIQESEYAVVVISESYASSKWCLKELTEIVKCKREYRLTVLPIFYHVDPSDVRNHEKGSFANGLAMHGKESERDKEKWRSALKEVGNIAGWHVGNNSYESKIVQEVCNEIFVGLNRHLSIDFKDVMGIESQVKKMMTLLRARDTTNDVHFIGICGMGGIGKTTLAQVVFCNISSQFEATCFVDDVTEKLKKLEIVHLQEQIIIEILGDKDLQLRSWIGGIRMMENRLQDKKILLVLDNVDDASQIEKLAKSHNWFGQGSRIILTSRNRQLLKGFVDEIYEVKGLSDNDALQVFCLKAFKKNHPIKNYENLSKEFVDYAQGLPLALKVFGSHLFGKKLVVWKSTLKQWKEEPPNEIWEKLKISFDGLSDLQKELFLDIACFFNREPVNNVIQYLESVGYFPKSNIETLQDKCLIKVFHGIFEMHDLLREMGQKIVRGKPFKDLGECSRLWRSEDIIHVLKNNSGTNAIKGIFLRLPLSTTVKLIVDGFSKMKKLKMLVIRPKCFDGHNTGDDKALEHLRTVEWRGDSSKFMLSNELCVLEWWGYPLECLPTDFEPENLIELKIPRSNIKHLWKVEKNLEKLKYIDLRDSQNLVEMPDFSGVPNLEKLDVKGTGIRQFSSSLILQEKLNVLNVGGSFSKPISFLLHNLPSSLKSLGKLDLSYCNLTDEVLPNDLGCLSSLRHLNLSGNKFTRIDCISKLLNVSHLEMRSCKRLKALPPKLLSWLDDIEITNCSSLTTLSDPRDILTSSETLVASDISLRGIYFGYDGKHSCTTHLAQSLVNRPSGVDRLSALTWGPTRTSNMPEWFTRLPDISGMFQRHFEVERFQGKVIEETTISRATEPIEYLDAAEGLGIRDRWGYALFIVYEIFKSDSCERKGEIHEVDENGNFSSTIFPVFVCELEVHQINDRKVPMGRSRRYSRTFEKGPKEYWRTRGKVPIVFRVHDIPSIGRNGVWVFIGADCFQGAGLGCCEQFGLCSISISSLNVEVKECGGRLVLLHEISKNYEIIKSISPRDLDSATARKALYVEAVRRAMQRGSIFGPGIPMAERDIWKEQNNCPLLTSLSDPWDILMASNILLEAFYFGYEDKCYRTYHLAQSFLNNWDEDYFPLVYPTTVTWGPTLTFDIPEWFTSLPDISGMFQHQFEAKSWGSGWGYALFIVYEVLKSDSCQRKEEIHEVDEDGNSSSTIFPVFVCELEVHSNTKPKFRKSWSASGEPLKEHWRTTGKVRIVFRVPDLPPVGRNGVWVFINGNCFEKAALEGYTKLALYSISISSLNVDIKECGGCLVLRHDHSDFYEIIKSISPHNLDSETLKDAFYEGGIKVFGDIKPGEKRKEGEEEGVEVCEEGEEEEGVEICEKGEEEGVEICEEGEEEEGIEICDKGKEVLKEGDEEEGVEICEEGEEEEGIEICEKGEEVLKEGKRKKVLKSVKKGKRKKV